MAVVLNTQLMLDPNNQIAHLADYTDLVEGTEYVISANFLPANTRFVFYGHFDIALTQAPIGVPSAQTEVPATISTVPLPAAATPPAAYPYILKDRLIAGGLNRGFEFNPGSTPPIGNAGGAGTYNYWVDTSTALPTLRQCVAAPRAAAGVYNSNEWVTLGTIDAAAHKFHFDLSGVDFLGGTSGSLLVNGPITTIGPNAGLSFNDRDGSSASWLWYAQAGVARLWEGADVVTIDGGGTLRANGNIIASGNLTAVYIHSTGNVEADNAVTAPAMTATGTIQAAQLTSTGNINAAGSISAALDVLGRDFSATRNISASSGTVTAAQLTSTGNLAVGGAVTAANMTATGTVQAAQLTSTGNVNVAGAIAATGNITGAALVATSYVYVGGNPALAVTTAGRLDIMTPSGDLALLIYGNPTWQTSYFNNTHQFGNSGRDFTYATFGVAGCFNQSGAWGTLSDVSLKDDVTSYDCGLEAIEKLSPVAFRYRPGTPFADPERTMRYGLVAQDVAKIIPEMVGEMSFDVGDPVKTLFPGHLVFVLVNAVKELHARLVALEP